MNKEIINTIIEGDCLKLMKGIEDKSIDMILCDLPYGTTACSWDTIISFNELWKQYKRIIKDNGAIVLTASQPFTSKLVMSNLKMFKYEWIWEKSSGSNFAVVKYQPFKEHENILVFGKGMLKYNPQLQLRSEGGKNRVKYEYKSKTISGEVYNNFKSQKIGREYDKEKRQPSSIQFFNNRDKDRGFHPTQKPVELFEYLIMTYTNENDLVLDNCIGSGTTAIACQNLKRNFIGIELNNEYVKISRERLRQKPML